MNDASLLPDGRRRSAAGVHWAVTSPHALATQAGASLLASGASAADAAIAVAATLSVVYPHMTGIGGDLFALYYDARTRSIACYNGSGRAAALADRAYYEGLGLDAVPERGGAAALTVPGAVDGWFALHQRYGTLAFDRLLEPAIGLARDGAPIARSVRRALHEERAVLDADAAARAAFGTGRGDGDLLVQPSLATTLERIVSGGRAWFYDGECAAAIDACCRAVGSPLRASDFAAHTGEWVEPITTPFRGFTSVTTPPNSQGLALLLAQSIYEQIDGTQAFADCSAEFVHATVESIRLAYEDRDKYVCDPAYATAPLGMILSRGHAAARAATIDPNTAVVRTRHLAADRGGTTYFACVDAAGNAVSVIQSIYQHFGAGVVVGELGIVLHNRGCWFVLDENAPRALAPGRRPFHTLIANMLTRGDEPTLVYGSMGGDAQPQTGLALSIRIGERGVPPQAAIDRPRWRWHAGAGDGLGDLTVEARIGAASIAGLRARGHHVFVAGDWDEAMGHAGAIVIDRERGLLLAGSDPRSDGLALCG